MDTKYTAVLSLVNSLVKLYTGNKYYPLKSKNVTPIIRSIAKINSIETKKEMYIINRPFIDYFILERTDDVIDCTLSGIVKVNDKDIIAIFIPPVDKLETMENRDIVYNIFKTISGVSDSPDNIGMDLNLIINQYFTSLMTYLFLQKVFHYNKGLEEEFIKLSTRRYIMINPLIVIDIYNELFDDDIDEYDLINNLFYSKEIINVIAANIKEDKKDE